MRGTELAKPEDTTREDILKDAGYEQIYDVNEIITRMPTPEEVERLEAPDSCDNFPYGFKGSRRPAPATSCKLRGWERIDWHPCRSQTY